MEEKQKTLSSLSLSLYNSRTCSFKILVLIIGSRFKAKMYGEIHWG